MFGVRISYSFVYGVLAQAFSVLSVLVPVLVVMATVPMTVVA